MNRTEKIILSIILFAAFILRFYHLTFQSLWMDELHTMIEADPSLSVSELFNYLKCCDQHPPLFFFLEKFLFGIFGHSEWTARALTATAGTVSVWAMFLVGKELYNNQLGFIAALLTTVNYYNIQYSQEARGYILAFLFASFSLLYFIKLLKQANTKIIIRYIIFTLLLMYTHYYGLFVFVAQGVIAFVYWLTIAENKTKFFKHGAIALIGICVGYAAWIPNLLNMSNIKSFWISPVPNSFAIDYFYEYFGNSDLLKPFLLLFMVAYFIKLFLEKENIKNAPVILSFLICSIWIFIIYLIPYLRSIFVVPMLFPRYTIVILPAVIIMLSFGINLIPNQFVRNTLLTLFVLISLIDIVFVKKFYTAVNKTQFRELTTHIAESSHRNLPIINPQTAWHFQYYAKKFDVYKNLMSENTDPIIDSISQLKNGSGFWLAGAHNTPKLPEEKIKMISANYVLTENLEYYNAWLQLYLPVNAVLTGYTPLEFHESLYFTVNNEKVVALWGEKLNANTFKLAPGKYNLKIISRGTKAANEYAKVNVLLNNKKIGEYITGENTQQTDITFDNNDESATILFEITNDFTDPATKEDRNLFITKALISKVQ